MPRYRANQLMAQVSAAWNAMSQQEKVDVTDDLLEDLNDHREMKALAVQNVPINAFHDAQVTIKQIEDEVMFISTI